VVTAESVLGDALERWGYLPRQWRLGPVTEVTVMADRDRLALALDALLENAIAHTGSGDEIEVSARRADGHVVLMVADSGTGIAPADLDRIFHRFARANPQRSTEAGGFGLGLALVQAIATAHGGSVQVRSTPGRGAAFEIILPVSPAPAAAVPEPVMTSFGPGSGSAPDGSGPDR
jgi:signal transduction histidine kinase